MFKLVKKIDARGLSCPQPVLMVKKALEQSRDGVEVLVDNNVACMNIKRFFNHEGYKVSIEELEDEFIIRGTK